MPTYKLTQEFRSLLNIDNHTRPYDQYLANRMKALTNKTEDCLLGISHTTPIDRRYFFIYVCIRQKYSESFMPLRGPL